MVLISLTIIIPTTIILIILATTLWIIHNKNRNIITKLKTEKKQLTSYKQQINNLKNTPSKNLKADFKKLNTLARNFFNEYYSLPLSKSYLELARQFNKNKKTLHASFCKQMSNTEYTGKPITQKEITNLTNQFERILNEY